MRPQQKAALAVLAFANLALLGAVALAAASPQLAPRPALLALASWPTAPTSTGAGRPLPTPPIVHFQSPAQHNAPAPTATAAPAVIKPQDPIQEPTATAVHLAVPAEAAVEGVRGHRQSLPLSCESRSAADWAAFFGVAIDELEFLGRLPASDDPDRGFVGDVKGRWGQVPPNPYGVHAGPVARLLTDYGLRATPHRYMKWESLQAEIAAGRPVIVWVTGHVNEGEAQIYTAADGRKTVVAPFEHTVIVVGYTATTVTVVDGANVREHGLEQFLASWGVLRNMAVTADT
jgi:uncharacterized protein YvpB